MIATGMPKSDDALNLVQNRRQDTEAPRTLATGSPRSEERKHTPRHRDVSDSESSTFSSKSLGSDLRHMINQLQEQYREQNQDTRRGCYRCGSKPHGRGEDCPARLKICRFCKCTGHLRAMCPTFSAPGYLREMDEQTRDQEERTEKATDRKRERSASAMNDKPRKPQRKENDTNVPGNLERTRNRTNYD
jgi:hypothetical protein